MPHACLHENAKTIEKRSDCNPYKACVMPGAYDVKHYRIRKLTPFLKKISAQGTALVNLRFWCPKTRFACGRKAKLNGEKKFS